MLPALYENSIEFSATQTFCDNQSDRKFPEFQHYALNTRVGDFKQTKDINVTFRNSQISAVCLQFLLITISAVCLHSHCNTKGQK